MKEKNEMELLKILWVNIHQGDIINVRFLQDSEHLEDNLTVIEVWINENHEKVVQVDNHKRECFLFNEFMERYYILSIKSKTETNMKKEENEKLVAFENAARPLIAYLREDCHPHAFAMVTGYDAELAEGNMMSIEDNTLLSIKENIGVDSCVSCGGNEIDHNSPTTMFDCKSTIYDGQIETFKQSIDCMERGQKREQAVREEMNAEQEVGKVDLDVISHSPQEMSILINTNGHAEVGADFANKVAELLAEEINNSDLDAEILKSNPNGLSQYGMAADKEDAAVDKMVELMFLLASCNSKEEAEGIMKDSIDFLATQGMLDETEFGTFCKIHKLDTSTVSGTMSALKTFEDLCENGQS